MHDIPEEAVKAALETWPENGTPYDASKQMRAALTAALPFLPVQGDVKKLEWELVSGDHYAEGAGTHYNIYETKPGLWNSVTVKPGNVRLATNVDLEAAKAAAQADYSARILSALDPSAARELALEEAVRKHLKWFERFICDQDELNSSTPRKVAQNAQDAAAELRAALSSPDHADAGKVEGDGWRPIESAPKDGTIVLLGWNDPDIEEIGAVAGWYEGGPADKCWYDQYHEPVTATHWMPLRPLPSAPSEGAE